MARVGLDEVGLLLDGDVVELVEHLAGVGAAEEEEAAEGDAALRRGIVPRNFRNELLEDLVIAPGVVGPAVVAIDVAAQEQSVMLAGNRFSASSSVTMASAYFPRVISAWIFRRHHRWSSAPLPISVPAIAAH